MSIMMLKMSIWDYLIPNIFGKIWNIFENDTECERDNVGKFWGKNKWKLLHTETFKRLVWAVTNTDNARKKYVNIERLSSDDIFVLLDSIESDDEGDIGNIMNDPDTEFVAEDESVISTNIIRKEEIGDQSSSISVPETSIHILNILPISPLLLPPNLHPISQLLLPIKVLPISHLLLLLLDVLLISHPNLLLLPQLLYPKTPSGKSTVSRKMKKK